MPPEFTKPAFDLDMLSRHKQWMDERSSPLEIFDARLIRQRLVRAATANGNNFLIPPLTEELLERLGLIKRDFETILDVGTPNKYLSLRLASALPNTRIIRFSPIPETSPNPGIAHFALEGETLPAPNRTADLAVSVLAFQYVNDLPGLLTQIRRMLRPDGLLLACMLGGQTLRELRLAFVTAESEISGGVSPRVAPFADIRDAGALLQRAGFALPVTDSETLTVRYANLIDLFHDLRAMGATNALRERSKKPLRREIISRVIEIYQRDFSDPDGRVRATFEVIWLSGWVPHKSQQKPLMRGTPAIRLADALRAKKNDPNSN